jgi:hypothetical protein
MKTYVDAQSRTVRFCSKKKEKKTLHVKAKVNTTTTLTADSLGEQRCRISDKNRQVDNPSAIAKGTAEKFK